MLPPRTPSLSHTYTELLALLLQLLQAAVPGAGGALTEAVDLLQVRLVLVHGGEAVARPTHRREALARQVKRVRVLVALPTCRNTSMWSQCRVRKGAGSQSVVSVCQHTLGG